MQKNKHNVMTQIYRCRGTGAKHKGDSEVWENDHRLLVVLRMDHFIFSIF